MSETNVETKITAIIARNDKLIQELERLHLLNEKEMNLYRLIETSPYFSFQKSHLMNDTIKVVQVTQEEEAVKKLQNEAATKIQKAYRNHLFHQRCRRRLQQWNIVTAKKSIELIDKISKTMNKRPVPVKFDLTLWKDECKKFSDARKKRAVIFEKRNALLENIKMEKSALASSTDAFGQTILMENSDVFQNLPQLKPYQYLQVEKELLRRLDLAEDEAFISAL